MPHIVYIIYSFSTGGIEKVISTLISSTRNDYRHTIVCLTHSGRFENFLPKEVQVISMGKIPGNSPFFFFRLARVLKRLKPDIVHTLNWAGIDGIIASRMAGIKNIVHGEHGWGMDDPYGQNLKRIRIRKIMSYLVREYICVSHEIQSWLRNIIKINKPITCIYNGVDSKQYYPVTSKATESENTEPQDFHIGIVARLDPIKDHVTVIKAFRSIKETIPNARLSIIGDGPQRKNLERLAQGDLQIRFLGDRCDVPFLLHTLDVFVLPSLNEGISNTILEAMAAGIPPIATNVGGNPEIITDNTNGRLFKPKDWKTLAKYLLDYYQCPKKRKEHGKEARRTVTAKFSIEKMVSGYKKIWTRIIKSNNAKNN